MDSFYDTLSEIPDFSFSASEDEIPDFSFPASQDKINEKGSSVLLLSSTEPDVNTMLSDDYLFHQEIVETQSNDIETLLSPKETEKSVSSSETSMKMGNKETDNKIYEEGTGEDKQIVEETDTKETDKTDTMNNEADERNVEEMDIDYLTEDFKNLSLTDSDVITEYVVHSQEDQPVYKESPALETVKLYKSLKMYGKLFTALADKQ